MPYDIQNEYAWENDDAYNLGIASAPALPATSAPASGGFASGVSSLFSGLGGLLGSVAQGVGQGIASQVTQATNSGRSPGSEQYADPTSRPAGSGTATILPGVPNTALLIGAGVVGFGLLAVLLSRR